MSTRRVRILVGSILQVAAALAAVGATPAPIQAQTAIAAIDFDSVPDGTTFAGSQITLQGNTVVQGGLALAGPLTLGEGATITFDPPRLGSLVLAMGDFVPFDSNAHWRIGAAMYIGTVGYDELIAVAPVHLPTQATVTGFRCWFYDNDPVIDFGPFAGARLEERMADSLTFDPRFLVSGLDVSHQADALIEAVGTQVFPLVVSSTSAYQVVFDLQLNAAQTTPAGFRFYGCRIDYQVSTWTP